MQYGYADDDASKPVITREVKNPKGVWRDVRSLTLNGESLAGDLAPATPLRDESHVEVILG